MSPCSSDCIFRASRQDPVRRTVSEDSGGLQLCPSALPVPAAPVHRERELEELVESRTSIDGDRRAICRTTRANFSKSACLLDRIGQRSKNGITLLQQIQPVSNDTVRRARRAAIRLDVAATESGSNQLEHLGPVTVLADMKLRHGAETRRRQLGFRCTAHREASFSVDVACDVTIQPFLPICSRTRHVVTIVNARLVITMSSAGCSEFQQY